MSKSKRYPSSFQRSKRTRNKRVRSTKQPLPSRLLNLLFHFIIKAIIVALVILIFLKIAYNLLPDVINLDFLIDKDAIRQIVREELNSYNQSSVPTEESVEEQPSEPIAQTEPDTKVQVAKTPVTSRSGSILQRNSFTTKATYYHPGDDFKSTNRTGSGLTTSDFTLTTLPSGKQIYTYKGKLVVATATTYLINNKNVPTSYKQEGKHYFKYYDTFTTTLEGNQYECIVLDSCGAAMWASNPKRSNRLLYTYS